jgi:hypothetical protein
LEKGTVSKRAWGNEAEIELVKEGTMDKKTIQGLLDEFRVWIASWERYKSTPQPVGIDAPLGEEDFVASLEAKPAKVEVHDHPGMCENCFYSWWKYGEPVTPDPCDQGTLNNGGCGECRHHSPSPEGMRKFPVVFPNDGCGDFMERKTQ